MKQRTVKRVTVQLKPEHVRLIKKALKASGQKDEPCALEDKKLRDEVLKALEGRAVL